MDIEKVAAKLDQVADAEQKISQSRILMPNQRPQQLQLTTEFVATALINLHIRLRRVELHLGIVERLPEPGAAGEEKVN